jgi:hypothetical protein
MLSKFFNVQGGGFWDASLTGVQWAAAAYGAGQMIGGWAGLDDPQTDIGGVV